MENDRLAVAEVIETVDVRILSGIFKAGKISGITWRIPVHFSSEDNSSAGF